MKNISNRTIGEIVVEDYRLASIFGKYKIDFCCGGKVTLASICSEKNIDISAIIKELETAKSGHLEHSRNYGSWKLPFLIDYIMNTHHAYLKENTDKIAIYANKIAAVHSRHHPEVIEIAAIFNKIAIDMAAHLREEEEEEEEVFFPAVKRVDVNKDVPDAKDITTIESSLSKLSHEHDEIGNAVHRIHHLSGEYAIPVDVCNTFVITYQKLNEFENDLHKHVHLENNILFKKTAQLIKKI